MKRQTQKSKTSQLLKLLRGNLKAATSAALLTSLSLTSFGQQYTSVLEQGNNVKGYSTEMVTDYDIPAEQGETVKVGTIYDYTAPGQHVAHFLNIDNAGVVNSTVYYQDPNFEEIRAVDIVGDENSGYGASAGSATYYITCQGRTLRDNDRVLIIPVDRTGAMVGPALRIYPSNGSGVTDNDVNMYPLHSIYNANTGAVFVTGYMTTRNNGTNGTSLSGTGEPDYTSDKYAFILKAEWDGVNWIYNPLTDIKTVNTVFTGLPGGYIPKDDFDIGMRLVEVNAGNDIFMTGSVNNFVYNGSSGTTIQHSATMNVVFDNNLTTPASSVTHFRNGSEVTYFGDEYGVGLVQNANGDYYVIGNYFIRTRSTFTGKGFDPLPQFFWGTWIDNAFNFTTAGNTRATFNGYDYAWGLQTLDGLAPISGNPNASRFVLAGMEVNEWCATSYNDHDIRAFLHDIEFNYLGGNITATYNHWTTFHTQLGTGDAYVDANSYPNLGGGISNMGWNPTFAAREDENNDVYFAAPTWRNIGMLGTPVLNMKNVRVENDDASIDYLDDPNCPGSNSLDQAGISSSCGLNPGDPYITESIFALGDVGAGYALDPFQNHPSVVTDDALTPDSGPGAMTVSTFAVPSFACGGTPNYKNGNLAEAIEKTATTTIYPNPATDKIKVSLANTIADDARVTVVLYNIYGQAISTLYQGQAAGLTINRELPLTDVATGIYLVNITVNGEQILNEKLTIN